MLEELATVGFGEFEMMDVDNVVPLDVGVKDEVIDKFDALEVALRFGRLT